MFMRVAYNQVYSGQGSNFFGGSLRVASGDDYARLRILAADSANCGAGILIGAVGDGAGIQNNDGCAANAGGTR